MPQPDQQPALLFGSMGPDSHAVDAGLDGKPQSLVHLAQPWAAGVVAQPFPVAMLQPAYDRGSLVLLDWASWDVTNKIDPMFSLDTILAGAHDRYLHTWAQAAAAWRHPLLLRFDWEMNGMWWPYGNQPAKFVQTWRYLHALFTADGATNVSWLWCPNVCAPAGTTWSTSTDKLASYYPGDDVVDWTGVDAYNWSVGDGGPWRTFSQLMNGLDGWLGDTYGTILKIAPNKPMCLAEFGCWDDLRKPGWLFDALASIPAHYPQIRAISYFNWAADKAQWLLSGDALSAFRTAIASPIWLPASTWVPPDGQPFGAPPLVVEAAPPGLARDLAEAEAQLADIRSHLQALVQLGAGLQEPATTVAHAERPQTRDSGAAPSGPSSPPPAAEPPR